MFCCSRFQRCLATERYPFIHIPAHSVSRGIRASIHSPHRSQWRFHPIGIHPRTLCPHPIPSIQIIFTVPYHTIDGSSTPPIDFHHRSFVATILHHPIIFHRKKNTPKTTENIGSILYHPIVIFSPMTKKALEKTPLIASHPFLIILCYLQNRV